MNSISELDISEYNDLLIYHLEDRVVVGCIESCLLELSAAQLIGGLLLVGVSSSEVWDLEATLISAGQIKRENLWSLLRYISDAVKFDVFTIATDGLDEESQLELADRSRDIAARCEAFRSSRIVESRVFVPEYRGELGLAPSQNFFTSRTANLIILPVDQQNPHLMAVPVRAADSSFIWHVAMEIVSLTCSWAGTVGDRIGFEPVMSGVANDPVVRFARSWITAVRFSESRLEMDVMAELPVPSKLSPAPVPRRVLDSTYSLYPIDFRIESPDEPELYGLERATTPRTWLLALMTLPKTVWLGLDRVKANLREELVDDIVGENPWVGHIFDQSDFGDSTERLEVETGLGPADPVTALSGFDTKIWSQLMQDVLGMVDGGGGEQAAAGRRDTGSESFVIMDRRHLTSDAVLSDVTQPNRPEKIDRLGKSELESLSSNAFTESEDTESKLEESSTEPVELEESEGGGPEGQLGQSSPEPVESAFEVPENVHRESSPTLLSAMTQRSQDEVDRCRKRLFKFKDEFEHLARSIREADPVHVTGPVGLAPLAAVWLTIVSLSILSPLYNSLDLSDWLGPEGRLRVFVLGTAVTVALLLLPVKPNDPKRAQSSIVLSCALGSLVTATLLMFPPTGGFMFGIACIACLVVLGILVWKSELAKHRPRQRAVGMFSLVVYVTFNIIVVFNLRQSGLQDSIAGYRGRIFFITIVVAIVTLIVSTIILALVMKRILHLQGGWRQRADYLKENARWEGDHLPILEAIRTNWLGSAAALDYIIRNPYGRAGTGSSSGDDRVQPEILRLRVLERQPPQVTPPPGWLGAKYRLVAEEYRQKYGGEEPPERSRQVSTLNESLLGSETGGDPRWDFARRLRLGEFDRLLADRGTADAPEPDRADVEAMSKVAPTGPAPLLVGFLGDAAARMGNVDMETTLWWPENVEAPEDITEPRPSKTVIADQVTIYQTVRVDVSDPVRFSDLDPGAHMSDDWDKPEESAGGDLLF